MSRHDGSSHQAKEAPQAEAYDTSACVFPVWIGALVHSSYDDIIWDDGTKGLVRQAPTAGYYGYTASLDGCMAESSVTVKNEVPVSISMPDTIAYCKGSSVDIKPYIAGTIDSLRWSDGLSVPVRAVSEAGVLTLRVYHEDCYAERIIIVLEDPCLKAHVFFPNVFTPNDDGVNDVFIPNAINIEPKSFIVFDRWGGVVFSSDGKTGWDGTIKGKKASPGVYAYVFKYYDRIEQREKVVGGDVTIVW